MRRRIEKERTPAGKDELAIKTGQGKIGEDEIEPAFFQGGDKISPGIDPFEIAFDALLSEHIGDEFRVIRVVLKVENTEAGSHDRVRKSYG